jgi:hypothetical protein
MPAAVPPGPYGRHLLNASAEHIEAVICRVWPGGRDAERRRTRGARILLQHLDGFPGRSWRQRWEASGLNESGRPVNVLIPGYEGRKEICTGMACLLGLRVIRPSLRALRSTRFHGYGERFLTAQRDPLLEDFWTRVQDQPVHPMHHTAALFDVAVTLTTQGIALAGLTPEAFLHYVWQSRDQGLNMKARGKQNRGQFAGQLAWPVLHEMGQFAPATPSTVRAAVLAGRRSLEELVDRYEIRHQGIRQLILDYLARRRSELDYSSLDQHARSLAGLFWAKIEALAPGHPDLRIDAGLYEQWRQSLNTRENGQDKRHEVERILRSQLGGRRARDVGAVGGALPDPRQRAARAHRSQAAHQGTDGRPDPATPAVAPRPRGPPRGPLPPPARSPAAGLAASRRGGLHPRRPSLPAQLESR